MNESFPRGDNEANKSSERAFIDADEAQAFYDASYEGYENLDEVLASWENLVGTGANVDIDSFVDHMIFPIDDEYEYADDAESYGWILQNLDRIRSLGPQSPRLTDPEVLKQEIFERAYVSILFQNEKILTSAVNFGIPPEEIFREALEHDSEPEALLEDEAKAWFEAYGVDFDPEDFLKVVSANAVFDKLDFFTSNGRTLQSLVDWLVERVFDTTDESNDFSRGHQWGEIRNMMMKQGLLHRNGVVVDYVGLVDAIKVEEGLEYHLIRIVDCSTNDDCSDNVEFQAAVRRLCDRVETEIVATGSSIDAKKTLNYINIARTKFSS